MCNTDDMETTTQETNNMSNTINTVKTTQVPANKLAHGDIYIGNKECGSDAEVRIVDFVQDFFSATTLEDTTTVVHFIDGSIMEADSSAGCDVMGRVEQFTYCG